MTLLGKMDRLVFATGFDRILFMKFQPRTFRWAPLLVIAGLVVGYAMMARTLNGPPRPVVTRGFFIGLLVFWGAFLAASFLRVFGPRFRPTHSYPLDERELMVKARAYATSGMVLAGFAMLACFYFAGAEALQLWQPHTPNDWITLGFGIQAGSVVLPTLIASWIEPRPDDQED